MSYYLKLLVLGIFIEIFFGCKKKQTYEKGFQVESESESENMAEIEGLGNKLEIRPGSVLITANKDLRITTLYKVNYNKDRTRSYIGDHYSYFSDEYEYPVGNNWNQHIIPGFQIIYGFNMVNLSFYQFSIDKAHHIFEKPVLIKNLYLPSQIEDTLNFEPVNRKYFMVSAYNEDTNKDGFINAKDLRRMFLFNEEGQKVKTMFQENLSAYKSEYDSENDVLFVFNHVDSNRNGTIETDEPVSIYWIDLKDPLKTGKQF